MAENVVGGQADREQVGRGTLAELLVNHQFLGKRELVLIGEGRGADHFVEAGIFAVFRFAVRGGAQNRALGVFPFAIPIFGGAGRVEILHPLWKVIAVIGGRDPLAALGIDPVGGVARESGGKYRGAVF